MAQTNGNNLESLSQNPSISTAFLSAHQLPKILTYSMYIKLSNTLPHVQPCLAGANANIYT